MESEQRTGELVLCGVSTVDFDVDVDGGFRSAGGSKEGRKKKRFRFSIPVLC